MAKKILIVDDESDITTYLAMVLKANGFVPTVARDAQVALDKTHEIQPDLISLDIMMPKESGIAMYKRLKDDPKTERIPVIIVSGVGQEGEFDFRSYVPDESIAEPECFMEKPIDVDEYIRTIRQLTSSDRPPRRQEEK
jgi:twitching motility two-component system response regulator PilH